MEQLHLSLTELEQHISLSSYIHASVIEALLGMALLQHNPLLANSLIPDAVQRHAGEMITALSHPLPTPVDKMEQVHPAARISL